MSNFEIFFFIQVTLTGKKRRGRPSLLVREGKRVEGGRKKPGTKNRGKKWEEKRLTKKRETLEMIDEVLEVIGNPFEDMSIDEKKGQLSTPFTND